jgi:hypothetical protein
VTLPGFESNAPMPAEIRPSHPDLSIAIQSFLFLFDLPLVFIHLLTPVLRVLTSDRAIRNDSL